MSIRKGVQLLLLIFVLILLGVLFRKADQYTSTDTYCNSCHVHPHAHTSWLESMHHNDSAGVHVGCVACHLPPKGNGFYKEKIRSGVRDLYSYWFKDSTELDWQLKSLPENARHHTFELSCIECHPKLFPANLSANGEQAHLHYLHNTDELHCINCHIDAGHGAKLPHGHNLSFLKKHSSKKDTIFPSATTVTGFHDFTETIPGSNVAFDLIAVKGSTFVMGEKDTVSVSLASFYMGKLEVTWDEYLVFLQQTESEGRNQNTLETDAITGATPPWGNPDQGWGMGQRPAITMTHHAATVYCEWLSQVTGKFYRLPSEAEWEYAAQGGHHQSSGFSMEEMDDFVIYKNNAHGKTGLPQQVKPNILGIKNLLGNVREFCQDTYHPVSYLNDPGPIPNPVFQASDKGYVIRGGSFKSNKTQISPLNRDYTRHDEWLKTDPQIPKSIWWYSDCNDVGFRVVCEIHH